MACIKHENTGHCNHYKCPFSSETSHGYECVDIIQYKDDQFCEVGEDCLSKCPFFWQKGSGSHLEEAANEYADKLKHEEDGAMILFDNGF